MNARHSQHRNTGRSDLRELANVGPAIERHLRRVGVTRRDDLVGRDPVELFEQLTAIDGRRHDPCLLDTFMSAVDQAEGRPAQPWWHYTTERKRMYGATGVFRAGMPGTKHSDVVSR